MPHRIDPVPPQSKPMSMTAIREIELKLETDAQGAAALKRHPLLVDRCRAKMARLTVY